MGNCTGKPKVKETEELPPVPHKEETLPEVEVKTEGETKEIVEDVSKDDVSQVNKVETPADEEKNVVTTEDRSLGLLLKDKEGEETKEEKAVEPVKEELKTEIPAVESSSKVAEVVEVAKVESTPEEKSAPVVVTPEPEPVKAVEPVPVAVEAEEKAPVVEVPASKPTEAAPAPAPVTEEKAAETAKVAAEEPVKQN